MFKSYLSLTTFCEEIIKENIILKKIETSTNNILVLIQNSPDGKKIAQLCGFWII